ncbi:hypothetical protein TRICI_003855 [Trichomonascus ciferrii]|uniref:Uncharacterized protein n=1 Tax=Trichomonascus ciferrii TaxID=44093 RepID=A0A642V2Q8_9ASCO|nr:hypothetical protein TRICI_003855 [Trichomonascus ciferrii]
MAIFGGSINRLETQLRKLRLNGLWRGGRGLRTSNAGEAEIPSAEDFAIYEDSASAGENHQDSSSRRGNNNDGHFNNRSPSPFEATSERDITDIVLGDSDVMTLHSGEENREPREEMIQGGQEQETDDNETACYYENTEHRDVRRFSAPRSNSQPNQNLQQRLCVLMAVEHSFSFGSGLPVSQSRLRHDRQASRTTDPRKRNSSLSRQEDHTKRQSLPVVDTSDANLAQQLTNYSSSASRQTLSPDNHHKTIRPIGMFTDFASTALTRSWQRIKNTFKKPAQEPSPDQQKQSEDEGDN